MRINRGDTRGDKSMLVYYFLIPLSPGKPSYGFFGIKPEYFGEFVFLFG